MKRVNTPEELKLVQLLRHQDTDGFWDWETWITNYVAISLEELEANGLPISIEQLGFSYDLTQRIFATFIILNILNNRYEEHYMEWEYAQKKAYEWIQEMNIELDVIELIKLEMAI